MQYINITHQLCPLDQNKCTNYDNAYITASGVKYHKINDPYLWEGYSKGWSIVSYSLHHSDGYTVMYNILSEVLSKLNKNSPKIINIERPIYSNMASNHIHASIS